MARLDDLDPHLCSSGESRVEVIDLKPEQDTVAIGPGIGIADPIVVMLDLEAVQLEDERTL